MHVIDEYPISVIPYVGPALYNVYIKKTPPEMYMIIKRCIMSFQLAQVLVAISYRYDTTLKRPSLVEKLYEY